TLAPDEARALVVGDGLLVPASGDQASFTWLHRTFAEYLTGADLAGSALAKASIETPDVQGAARVLADALELRLVSQPEVVRLSFGYAGLVHPGLAPGLGPAVVAAAIQRLLDCAPADRRDETLALMGGVVAEL